MGSTEFTNPENTENFEDFYQKNIAPSIQKIELNRQNLDKKGAKIIPIVQGIMIALMAIASYFFVELFESYVAAIVIFLMGVVFIIALKDEIKKILVGKGKVKNLNHDYKSEIITKVISFFGEDFHYNPTETITNKELNESHLFDIKFNTKIKTDDVIRGKLNGNDFVIADMNMVSSLQSFEDNDDVGNTGLTGIGIQNTSSQNFNGFFVRMKLNKNADSEANFDGRAFILPKSLAEEGSKETVGGAKIFRDKSMTIEEQRSHNLKAFNPLLRGYHWKPEYAKFTGELERYEVIRTTNSNTGKKEEEYFFYTNNETVYQNLLENKALEALQQNSFADKESEDKVVEYRSFFQFIDKNQLDKAVEKKLIYAIHSGYVWVLIPSFNEKFEVDLSQSINKQKVKDIFEEVQLALMSISVFA